jgi:hypothetical protein
MIYFTEAIYALYPSVVRTVGEEAFDVDGNVVAYDRQAVEAKAAQMQAQQQRAAAYAAEADPLFFKAQRGEASMDDWTAAVEAIRTRFPYPAEAS